MKQIHILIYLSVLQGGHTFAQSNDNTEFNEVHISQDGNYFFHTLEKSETVYAVSKFYNTTLADIEKLNPTLNLNHTNIGQIIKVPISKELITHEFGSGIALTYTVKPKETLFTIARKYLDTKVSSLKDLNHLKSNSLDVGQILIVGFLPDQHKDVELQSPQKNGDIRISDSSISLEAKKSKVIPSEKLYDSHQSSKSTEKNDDSDENNDVFDILDIIDMMDDTTSISISKEKVLIEIPVATKPEEILESGLAFTEMVDISNESLFVLHPKARVNSEIELIYPMLNTRTMATVISELPKELYPENIRVVISPGVAKALGAKDNQFRVQMKFVE